jgi:hypothetical protein
MAVSSGVEVLPGDAANVEADLRNFRKQHRWDPFLDIDKLDNIDEALASGNIEKEAAIDESLIQEDSPYPEVRASVRFIHILILVVQEAFQQSWSHELQWHSF